MATVIGVRFQKAGKVYYFDPGEVWPNPGDSVIVETSRGVEMGEVITGARDVSDDEIVAPLKKVIRLAVPEDLQRLEFNRKREKEALALCQERVAKHKLEMKLVDVEYTFDGSKIIFYFTANGRVDFRDLVKDLASVFKMRIELRQIGVRDEAKMLGGLGACGRPICCAAFLGDFQPVSIKMAKEQNLSLNPTKISGQCGRLMCCLKYEQDYYEQALKKLPRVGREAVTPDGIGYITDINVIREKVRVRIRSNEDDFEVREYALGEVSKPAAGMELPEQRPPKPRKPRDVKPEEPKENAAEEKPRRRPPRPKGPKQSTEQFLDSLNSGAPASPAPEDAKEPKEGRGAPRAPRAAQKGEGRPRAESPAAAKETAAPERTPGEPAAEIAPQAPAPEPPAGEPTT